MEKCFVIQPFDDDKFDKRFIDIFEPAILNAGYEVYRIDKDLSVRIPIDEIEKGISESAFCFAEITSDNPNVWYELGYAFACNKDVVIVCSDERLGKFPFDIQHRQILKYKTSSTSDFNSIGANITLKIKALNKRLKTVEQLNLTPVVESEGLKSHEIALLILILEDQISSVDGTSVFTLKNEMYKAGYNGAATSIGLKNLVRNGMVETFIQSDNWSNGQDYVACKLKEKGEEWILANQSQFEFRKPIKNSENSDDNLPF